MPREVLGALEYFLSIRGFRHGLFSQILMKLDFSTFKWYARKLRLGPIFKSLSWQFSKSKSLDLYIAIQTSTIRPNVRLTCSTNRCEILGLRFLYVLKVKTQKSFFTFFALTRKDLHPTILPQFSFFFFSLLLL